MTPSVAARLAVLTLLIVASVAAADNYTGTVTKLTADEVVIRYRKDPRNPKSKFVEKKFALDKGAKFYRAPSNKPNDRTEWTRQEFATAIEKIAEVGKLAGPRGLVVTRKEGDAEVAAEVVLLAPIVKAKE